MDLIFFDLDGTLLNQASEISPFTRETLSLLREKNIAFTIATGRSLLSAQLVVGGHDFELPQIYNNGVTIWDPRDKQLTLENVLNNTETSSIIDIAAAQGITPFINAIDASNNHSIFHPKVRHEVERELINKFFARARAKLYPLASLPDNCQVTNISMIGAIEPINEIWSQLNRHEMLIAYTGPALEGAQYSWLDVHHRDANKGSAVANLKKQLNAKNIICFGDGDNDLSMFEFSDESYAPKNAIPEIKEAANEVIGHNHDDGVAHFLRERFSL